MKNPIVQINNLNIKYQSKLVLRDLNWTINYGENWLLDGESGSGKTTLAKAIADLQCDQIRLNFDLESQLPAKPFYVENWYQFKNKEGVANFYYQQRYTSQQAKDTHTVNAELASYGKENELNFEDVGPILIALGFANLKNATLIELSSGEHKKLQLVKALWLKPQLLILDQPYTGLDQTSRKNLNFLLDDVSKNGIQFILISNEKELPTSINCFATLEKGNFHVSDKKIVQPTVGRKMPHIPSFLQQAPNFSSNPIVSMTDVNVNYGEKQVLKHINWEVNAGEKWLLQGHNGSGKSTLLSLINGDHPQAYANTISLFGKERGSGESIWDIKRRIGLISPEFHWYFDASATVWQSIASGLTDSVGLFTTLTDSKKNLVNELIYFFELENYKDELLTVLPLGKQRLVLLARTIIKNPELLILDEPCQGLDAQQTHNFNQLVDELCNYGMTLIYVAHTEDQLPKCITHRLLLANGTILSNTKNYHTQEELVQ
jgi:molybdate transport system ATP-binding protein